MPGGSVRPMSWNGCIRKLAVDPGWVAQFPSIASYIRLISCYLIEYTEDWSTESAYISEQKIAAEAAMITYAA